MQAPWIISILTEQRRQEFAVPIIELAINIDQNTPQNKWTSDMLTMTHDIKYFFVIQSKRKDWIFLALSTEEGWLGIASIKYSDTLVFHN